MPVSAKVADRIAAQMKRYQGVLATIQKKDISEADTVTVIPCNHFRVADLFVELLTLRSRSPRTVRPQWRRCWRWRQRVRRGPVEVCGQVEKLPVNM